MCIWQLRNFFAVKKVYAIVYLFNSIAVPQSENSFLLFAQRFFSEAEITTLSYIDHTGFGGRIPCEWNSLQSL